MGKIVLFNMVTLDGFFAGEHGEIDWHRVDEEFNQFAIKQLDSAAGLIFGRVTYQGMASYWPTPQAIQNDPVVAGKMNAIAKIVVSRTLQHTEWQNTRLVGVNVNQVLLELKHQSGGDLLIFGSGSLAAGLMRDNLIDEFRLMVNPVILGRGRGLFQDIRGPISLQFVSSQAFGNGNVLMVYRTTPVATG